MISESTIRSRDRVNYRFNDIRHKEVYINTGRNQYDEVKKMNLKEAFRYQNKLRSLMDEAQEILSRDSNVTKTKNTYLRHKAIAEAEDETVAATPDTEYYEQITGIAQFLMYLLSEKEALFAAIRKAKDALDIDMDSEVSRFNAEGNQISYRCDVKRVTTINYDRNVIRRELSKLNKASDETSTKLDLCLVTSTVDYEPPFDGNDSFADAFERFLENAGA